MSIIIAEQIIKKALATDPRTKHLRVSCDGSVIRLSPVADKTMLETQTVVRG